MNLEQSIRDVYRPERIRHLTTYGHAMLSRIRRDEGWLDARYLLSIGRPGAYSRVVLDRIADYETVTFDPPRSGDLDPVVEAIDAALVAFGKRLARGLFAPTSAHDTCGNDAPGLDTIEDWLPETVSEEPWKDVVRTKDPVRFAGHRVLATGMPIEDAVVEADARAWLEGGTDNAPVYVGPETFEMALACVGARYVAGHGELAWTWTPRSATARAIAEANQAPCERRVLIVRDDDCPERVGYRVPDDAFAIVSCGPAPRMSGVEDGMAVLRLNDPKPGDKELSVRFAMYGNTALMAPQFCVRIGGLGT